jgi:OPT family oligopeptide transporter
MFPLQMVGTIEAALVYLGTAWWLLTSVKNICNTDVLPADSPWTCPSDHVFFDASVIWGLVGPKRIFGSLGLYSQINWWFLIGIVLPIPVWIATRIWPRVGWIRAINMPILIGATGNMPPATAINYTSWIFIGFIFNYVVYKRRKGWWTKYNYVLSAALDAGFAFMGVCIYFVLGLENRAINWWGVNLDNCPLATCPTQPGLGANAQLANPLCPLT